MEPMPVKKMKQSVQVRPQSNSVVKKDRKRISPLSSSCSSSASKVNSLHHAAPGTNAARERSRVKTLRMAFMDLQRSLPAVPRDTKLSKLDVLVLATTYIAHLTKTLSCLPAETPCDHPTGHADMTQPQDSQQAVDQLLPVSPAKSAHGRLSAQRSDCEHSMSRLSSKASERAGHRIAGRIGRVPGVLPCSTKHSATGRQGEPSDHGNSCQTMSRLRVNGLLHPVKKWPMRTRLYAGIMASTQEISKATCSRTHLY